MIAALNNIKCLLFHIGTSFAPFFLCGVGGGWLGLEVLMEERVTHALTAAGCTRLRMREFMARQLEVGASKRFGVVLDLQHIDNLEGILEEMVAEVKEEPHKHRYFCITGKQYTRDGMPKPLSLNIRFSN